MSERHLWYEEPGRLEVYCHRSPATLYPEESHETLQVCIPFEGARYDVTRQSETGSTRVQRLGATDVLVLPITQPHAIDWREPAHVLSLQMSSTFVEEALGMAAPPVRDTLVLRDTFILASARHLRAALTTGTGSPALIHSVATLIAHRIGLQSSSSASLRPIERALSKEQVEQVDRYIGDHLDKPISLKALADLVGLSYWHFLRRFEASKGATPHAFIIQRRLRHAQSLLAQTDMAIVDVALEIGMTHSHFSRTFLRAFGLSPSAYRWDRIR